MKKKPVDIFSSIAKELIMIRIEVLDLMHLAKYALSETATECDKRIYERQAQRVKSILDSYYNAVDDSKPQN